MSAQVTTSNTEQLTGLAVPPCVIKLISNSKGINYEIRTDSTCLPVDVTNAVDRAAQALTELTAKGLVP